MAVLWSGVSLCYGVGWKCRRIIPIRTDRDDPSQLRQMVSIRVRGVVEWGENVSGSSQSGQIVTTHHSGDRWCWFGSVRLCARDFENIHEGLYFANSSLTKNQRPFKPALGWITDFSSVAKLFVWNVCHLYVHSLENYSKQFSPKLFCIRIWSKKEVTATLKWK